ncbi:MAG: lipocalin-like domain-containing protein [Rhizonema sp. PD38]|nr:lipocalin-like domain-containing protein [Rhizonema sp. PD38]
MLSYDTQTPSLRKPTEEWEPHRKQTDKTTEWWYSTSLVFDAAGNPYFLFWSTIHFLGQKTHPGNVPEGKRFCLALTGITDYKNNFHAGGYQVSVMSDEETWKPEKNAVCFALEDTKSEWSFEGNSMHLVGNSPYYSCDVEMSGAETIMYAKDKLNVLGFIQEGPPDELSFYYSVPRLSVNGKVSFKGKDGIAKNLDVHGTAWVDRQWGDFNTKSWEWSSFRFLNGARVNLYNFANGHQVATYQDADGYCQWINSFVVHQNNYMKIPDGTDGTNGTWVSWGWSYDFPIDVEGSRNYTVKPFSELDTYVEPTNKLYEGPGHLIDDKSGAIVGYAVNESMDVKLMQNFPYGPNQR